MSQFYTDEWINETYPVHYRTSCSDARPDTNATIDGNGCLRCNALVFQREEWQQTVVAAAKHLRALKEGADRIGTAECHHQAALAYRELVDTLENEPIHTAKNQGDRPMSELTICRWLPFSEKPAPKNRQEVLCAWKNGGRLQGNGWTYEVLIHWPDGLLTDTNENEIEPENGDLPPILWMEIPRPSQQKELI